MAQTKKGLYEVSMPWVPSLAEPLRGPSAAQLKEELMFRLIELAHTSLPPFLLDRLIPPVAPYLNNIYVEIERQIEPDRPPVSLTAVIHVVAGSWGEEEEKRLWIPKAPQETLVLPTLDDLYATVNQWVRDYADEHMLDSLEPLQSMHHAYLDTITVDIGYPSLLDDEREGPPEKLSGRLTRPETLEQVATNLSHRAEDSTLSAAYGREKLVDELVDVFTSKRPMNVCLVGPSGVGKTAIVHEAARRAWAMNTAYQERKDIWQSAGDRIIAGMSIIGQWEMRTEAMCRELKERKDVLFVESLIGMLQAGKTTHGDSNVARFIEPYLEQDHFGIVTEATEETWTLARSIAPGFVDHFRRIQVPELGYKETLGVLSEFIRDIEAHHQVRYTADAMESVLHLSRRFFQNDAYPGKAVRLIKQCQYEALRYVNEFDWEYQTEVRVDTDLVARVVQRQTGLPLTILEPGKGRAPDEIRRQFESRVFGQPEAIEAVSALVATIEQGLSDPRKPLGSFLFIGPSGVGKTETAKAIATDLFGSVERMIRFDMSEFSSSMGISRLIGTSRDPDGELTTKVRLQPFCVLLFDEIEKAHPMVIDLLLQVLGDGRLTDAAGRNVDFRNAVIILTSNLGAGTEERWMGFSDTSTSDRRLHYLRAAETFFRPEIFNRIDTIIAYRPLDAEALRRIARRTLQGLLERRGLRQAQVMVDVDQALIDYLATRSVDKRYGARTLAHRIERTLITPLAEKLISEPVSQDVTRVVISPSQDGVQMDFIHLNKAPRQSEKVALAPAPKELAGVVTSLEDLQKHLLNTLKDARFSEISAQYETILDAINNEAKQGSVSAQLADQLTSREHVINQIERIEERLQGLHDPKNPGEFSVPTHSEETKSRLQGLSKMLRELEEASIWADVQLESLANGESGVTLVFQGLSGPAGEIMSKWHRWVEVIQEKFELNGSFAYLDRSAWQTSRPRDLARAHGFAFSSTAPGARAIAHSIGGFTWCPRAASIGHHALLHIGTLDEAHVSSEALRDALKANGTPHIGEDFIEFVESEGHLEDVRTGLRLPIPEDRGQNLNTFMTQILVPRLYLQDKNAHQVGGLD